MELKELERTLMQQHGADLKKRCLQLAKEKGLPQEKRGTYACIFCRSFAAKWMPCAKHIRECAGRAEGRPLPGQGSLLSLDRRL